MSNALLSSVSGMRAHQKMLDVAGNNLANQNTTAFKASRVTFADLLSETIREASQPTSTIGGTNPQQVGSGVKVASVDRNMAQGSLINTGEPLDMAIEGAGYFTLNDGQQDVYTRVGTFAVDSDYYMVDPSTGYRVQRIGSEGVADGFQEATSNAIRIPYDVALPARGTENISYTGNLSADESTMTTNVLSSGVQYTVGGAVASGDTKIVALDQADSFSGTINISGTNPDGTAPTATSLVVDANTTLDDLVDAINNGVGTQEQYQGKADNAVATAGTNYITAVGADSILSITFDGVTRTIGSDNEGNADVLTVGLDSGGTLTVTALATLINTAFNGQTGTVSGVMGDIASAVDLGGGNQYVLQIEATGVTPNGAITDFAIAATLGDVEFLAGGPNDDVAAAEFTNSVDGSGTNECFTGADASIVNGEFRLTDDEAGFSQTDLTLAVADGATGTLDLPRYCKILAAGGESVRNTNMEVFDSQGISHILSASFVRRDAANTWDLVITSVTGDATLEDRRIKGVTFNADGSYGGLDETIADASGLKFKLGFAYDDYAIKTLNVNLGLVGEFNGLSQFGGSSTVAPSGQDGFASGVLSSLSVARDGILVGVFTNGVRKDVAALKIAVFQNPTGLEGIGGNYYSASANSGEPVPTKALSGGAGAIHGGSLEGSNVEIANEFVNLIQAQNGFQANARSIRVSTEMLKELTNLIR